jgi:hypothetical protein
VLASVGASRTRDAIDTRVIAQLTAQTGGVINSQDDVGGWPPLPPAPAPPADLDRDGMADDWELGKGLDPGDAADRNALDLHPEYTNLEVYLASLVGPEPVSTLPLLGHASLLLLAVVLAAGGVMVLVAVLPLPLDEVRREIGAPRFKEVHARGVPSKGKWLARTERRIEGR